MPTDKIRGFSQAMVLNVTNVLVLVTGFVLQLAVVKCHGTSAKTDFYFLLIIVPQMVTNLSSNIIKYALLPFMVHRREELGNDGEAAFVDYFEGRVRRVGIVLAVVALGVGLLQGVFSPGWNAGNPDLLVMIASAPFLIIFGVVTGWYATVLQSRKIFWPPMAGLLFSPFCGVVFGVALASLGVWPFVAGQSMGMIGQYVWLKTRVQRSSPAQIVKKVELSAEEHREVRSKVILLFLSGVGLQAIPFIERSVAQRAGIGAVTAIALASRLGSSITPVILTGAVMMLFTTFAELVAKGQTKEAVSKLMRMLVNLQLCLAGVVLVGPFALKTLLPLMLPKPEVVKAIAHVFPDYLFAGCIGAANAVLATCYYAVFKDFQVQLYIAYISLGIYLLLLSVPLWTSMEFGMRTISMAYAVFSLLAMPTLALHLAFSKGGMFPGRYLLSLLVLVSAWIVMRHIY